MTPDKKRAILEAAAKACGIDFKLAENNHITGFIRSGVSQWIEWNPLTNSADTASMCARVGIDTEWEDDISIATCTKSNITTLTDIIRLINTQEHDGTPEGKEVAWRLAATMVAAKLGGYIE